MQRDAAETRKAQYDIFSCDGCDKNLALNRRLLFLGVSRYRFSVFKIAKDTTTRSAGHPPLWRITNIFVCEVPTLLQKKLPETFMSARLIEPCFVVTDEL